MALTEFSLRLQHGIAGGFAPPTPEAIYTLTKAPRNPNVLIAAAIRPIGTPVLQDAAPKVLSVDDPHTASLVSELYTILRVLPSVGSGDPYGLDTSIAWESTDFHWSNRGSEGGGCGGQEAYAQLTKEEKGMFKRAVKIVDELVEDVGLD